MSLEVLFKEWGQWLLSAGAASILWLGRLHWLTRQNHREIKAVERRFKGELEEVEARRKEQRAEDLENERRSIDAVNKTLGVVGTDIKTLLERTAHLARSEKTGRQ